MPPKKFSKSTKIILTRLLDASDDILVQVGNPRYYSRYASLSDAKAMKKYYNSFYSLGRYGYIKAVKGRQKYYKLTKKGLLEAKKLKIKKKILKKKWDKKWRILIFDIPEDKKKYRDKIRRVLIDIGFYQIQKSVWVFPHNIIDDLYVLLPGFREGDWFEYIEATKISSVKNIREYFGI